MHWCVVLYVPRTVTTFRGPSLCEAPAEDPRGGVPGGTGLGLTIARTVRVCAVYLFIFKYFSKGNVRHVPF